MEIGNRIAELEPKLRKIAATYASGDPQVADDIYSAIVERALATCSPTDTAGYFCKLATWTAKNYIKSQRVYCEYVGALASVASDDEDGGGIEEAIEMIVDRMTLDPETALVKSEELTEMQQIVADFDAVNRKIVSMLFVGMNHREIAERVGISRSAVTQRVMAMRAVFAAAGITA